MRVLPLGGTGEIGDPYGRSEACTLLWPFPWTGGGWLSRTSNEATRSKPRD